MKERNENLGESRIKMELNHERITKKFSINCMEYKAAAGTIKEYDHWHSKMEICQMLDGMCDFIISGKTYTASKGDIIVIKSGEIHRFNQKYGDCKVYICTFEPMFLYNLKVDISNLHHHIALEELKNCGIEEKISESFDILFNERKLDQKCSELIFKANLLHIYGMLLRNFEKKGEIYKKDIAKLISFQKILEYISANFTENITLKSVADEFNYNPVYLSKMFRTRIGVNFKYYLDNIRARRAMELLLTTDMTVAEISQDIGYENIRTFNNVFKRITGVVPSTIKKKEC